MENVGEEGGELVVGMLVGFGAEVGLKVMDGILEGILVLVLGLLPSYTTGTSSVTLSIINFPTTENRSVTILTKESGTIAIVLLLLGVAVSTAESCFPLTRFTLLLNPSLSTQIFDRASYLTIKKGV